MNTKLTSQFADFSPLASLLGKEILLTGSTGFVGKVLLSMLLRYQPAIGHVHCVIRRGKGKDVRTRFRDEVLTSPVLAPVRTMLGDDFDAFVDEKLSVIDSDLSSDDLGLAANELADLRARLDLVLHCAGNTDFTPPLRDSLSSNTLGALHMLEFTRGCAKARLLHISTCYVAGRHEGLVLEEESLGKAFPDANGDELLDPRLELEQALQRDADVERASRDQVMTRRFRTEALGAMHRDHRPARREDLVAAEAERCRQRWVDEELRRIGEERATLWGWPNTYTYSKGLAERLLVAEAGSVEYAIVRPAIIESSVSFPEAGWNEGVNTSAPLIYLAWLGLQNLAVRPGLPVDFIPVDHICAGILMVAGALLTGRAKRVYQLSTSECNPISIDRIVELTALAHRRMRRKSGIRNFSDFVRQHFLEIQPVETSTYERWGAPTVSKIASGLKGWLKSVPAPSVLKPVLGAAREVVGSLEKSSKLVGKAVTTFLPYIRDNNYRFRCHNILELRDALSPAERSILRYEPDTIEWRQYWTEVHVPGLHRFTLPELEEKLRKKPRAVHTYGDLRELFYDATDRYADRTALRHLTARGTQRVTYRKLRQMSELAAARLTELGLEREGRVVLMSENRPEWAAAYFGITLLGATAVPVDPALEVSAIENILISSRASILLLSEKCAERCGADLKEIVSELGVHSVLVGELFDEADFDGTVETEAEQTSGLQTLASTTGHPKAPSLPRERESSPSQHRSQVSTSTEIPAFAGMTNEDHTALIPSDVASLIYTSGTTGQPKGVMLSHANFAGLLTGLLKTFSPLDGPRFVSVLPLHHTFEFTCGLLTPLSRGGSITYLEELNAKELQRAFSSAAMTHMVGVPALWQLLARNIETRAAERGPRAEKIVQTLMSLNRAVWRRFGVNLGPVLLAPVHRFFGGRQPLLISGGAALPEPVLKTFEGLGLRLLEGYGLTEAAPVLAVTPPNKRPVAGSVGRALPGVELRVHEPDEHGVGEIIARSPGVMLGYEGRPEETARTVRDGWLHTGDLGRIDKKGNVSIVGRMKDVILDASGENVYPDELEELYGSSPAIAELSVVGLPDGKGGEKPCALVVAAKDQTDALHRAMRHIDEVATRLPRHKRLGLVRFTDGPLPRTATRKIKRGEVLERLQRMLEAEKQTARPERSGPRRGPDVVWSIVAQVSGREASLLQESDDLALDLGLDSLQLVELQASLESALSIRLAAQDLVALRAIGDILDVIEARETASGRRAHQSGNRRRTHEPSSEHEPATAGPASGSNGAGAPGSGRNGSVAPGNGHGRVGRMGGESRPAMPVFPTGAQVASHAESTMRPIDAIDLQPQGVDGRNHEAAPLPEPFAAIGRKLLRTARETLVGHLLDVQVLGRAHIPTNGRFIAASNHGSHLDTPVVLQALGEAAHGMSTLAARDYFFDTPLKERLARQLTNLLPLDRNGNAAEGLEEAGRALEAGRSLLVFPEGTRSQSGRLATFKPGIGLLALRHRMDILPMHVDGTHAILPKGSLLPKGRRVVVRIGRVLPYRWLVQQTEGLGLAEASARVAQLVEQAVARLAKGLFDPTEEARKEDSLESVFEELSERYRASELERPVTYYLSLGQADDEKWTLHAEKTGCSFHTGKNGGADCVIKTSADFFRKIVRERYTPGMEDFMSGRLKTNDPALLIAFQRVFGLDS